MFDARLARKRRKGQYLRIQASVLARSQPEVAHALLDRYFELPSDYDRAQAFVDRAVAYLSQGRTDEAIAAYLAALEREAEFPNVLTDAYLDLPLLIAWHALGDQFSLARELLRANESRLLLPVDHFRWHAAHALLAKGEGSMPAARSHAAAALQEAVKTESGLEDHPHIGLVGEPFAQAVAAMRKMQDGLRP